MDTVIDRDPYYGSEPAKTSRLFIGGNRLDPKSMKRSEPNVQELELLQNIFETVFKQVPRLTPTQQSRIRRNQWTRRR